MSRRNLGLICKRGKELTMEDIEAQCVETERGCWEWQRGRDRKGYGRIRLRGKQRGAHVVSYTLSKGAVPPGICVLHRCDNPSCVRPDHLFEGTPADNVRDKIIKGRDRYVCGEENGQSKLTAELVSYIRSETKSHAELAKELGVSKGTIRDARAGRSWKSVEGKAVDVIKSFSSSGKIKSCFSAGEKNGHAKLTVEQVKYIRGSPKSKPELARELGVDPGTIKNARNGRSWKSVEASAAGVIRDWTNAGEKNGRSKLTIEQVEYVRASSKRNVDLARELAVDSSTISNIRAGKLWKHVKPSAA